MFSQYLKPSSKVDQNKEHLNQRHEQKIQQLSKVLFIDSKENQWMKIYQIITPLEGVIRERVDRSLQYESNENLALLIGKIRKLKILIEENEIHKVYNDREKLFDLGSALRCSLADKFDDIKAWKELFYRLYQCECVDSCLYYILGKIDNFDLTKFKPNRSDRLNQAFDFVELENRVDVLIEKYENKMLWAVSARLVFIDNFFKYDLEDRSFKNYKINTPDFRSLNIFEWLKKQISYQTTKALTKNFDFDIENYIKDFTVGNIPDFKLKYQEMYDKHTIIITSLKQRLAKIPEETQICKIESKLYIKPIEHSLRYKTDEIINLTQPIVSQLNVFSSPELDTNTNTNTLLEICCEILDFNWSNQNSAALNLVLSSLHSRLSDLEISSNLSNQTDFLKLKIKELINTQDLIDDTILSEFQIVNDISFDFGISFNFSKLLSEEYHIRRPD